MLETHQKHADELREMQSRIIDLTQKYKQTSASIIHAQNEAEKNREAGNAAIEMLRKYALQIGVQETNKGFDAASIEKRLHQLIKENTSLSEEVSNLRALMEHGDSRHRQELRDLRDHISDLQKEKETLLKEAVELKEQGESRHRQELQVLQVQMAALQTEKATLLNETLGLRGMKNNDESKHRQELQDSQAQIEALQTDKAALLEEVSFLKEHGESKHEEEIQDLKLQISALQTDKAMNDSPPLFSREKSLRMVRENEKLALLLTKEEQRAKVLEETVNTTQKLVDMITAGTYQEKGDLLEILDQMPGTSFEYEKSFERFIDDIIFNKKGLQ